MMQLYNGSQVLKEYRHLVMGDISGIQEFIFNVKSEGAAKTLKGRSFFVHALAELCIDLIDTESDPDNNLLFYNGGGSFYIFCKKLPDLKRVKEFVQRDLADMEIYLTITDFELNLDNFGKTWSLIHQKSNLEKLRKFSDNFDAFGATRSRPETAVDKDDVGDGQKIAWDWKGFVGRFKESKSFEILATHKLNPGVRVTSSQLKILGRAWKLDGNQQLANPILTALPLWEEIWEDEEIEKYRKKLEERERKKDPKFRIEKKDVIEFETLAHQAGIRTGTDKLGVLKMDVDFLGQAFQNVQKEKEAFTLSYAMREFFGNQLFEIWNKGSFQIANDGGVPFKNNIYILFAGGDDCMFIGGWDAIFEFAYRVRSAFAAFASQNKFNNLSISGSITVVDGKFPVVRFGDMAEQAIKAAKKEDENEKDRVSVFGQVLKWSEFEKARTIAHELFELHKNNKLKRRIIHRIQMSHLGYEKLQEKALNNGVIHNPQLWRLFYFIREYKDQSFDFLQKTLETYQKSLLEAITHKKRMNAAAMTPVAARWAEFLTRKKSNENE